MSQGICKIDIMTAIKSFWNIFVSMFLWLLESLTSKKSRKYHKHMFANNCFNPSRYGLVPYRRCNYYKYYLSPKIFATERLAAIKSSLNVVANVFCESYDYKKTWFKQTTGPAKRSDHSDLGRTKNFVICVQSLIFSKFWSDQ